MGWPLRLISILKDRYRSVIVVDKVAGILAKISHYFFYPLTNASLIAILNIRRF